MNNTVNKNWKLALGLLAVASAGLTVQADSARASALHTTAGQGSDPGSDWLMVWSDEFDDNHIDSGKWEHEISCDGGGNSEQQCYTDSAENSYVEDGVLKIVALPASGQALPYTSARLRTLNLGDWKYGRFEIRAKSPGGQGAHPAIWLLPSDKFYGGWPNSGEIDIFEAVNLGVPDNDGPGALRTSVYGTLHYGRDWPRNDQSGLEYIPPQGANPADNFHVYALEWEEGEIRWYVDGVLYQTQRQSEPAYNSEGYPHGLAHRGWYTEPDDQDIVWSPAPYDKAFHLILNFAVGGDWAENTNEGGVDPSAFNAGNVFEIDYVRVYECTSASAGGQGCATTEAGYDEYVDDGGTLVEGKAPFPVAPSDGIAEPITFFETEINPAWPAWDCCGGTRPGVVVDEDSEHAQSIEFRIGAQPAVVGFTTKYTEFPAPYDGTGFSNTGALTFDIKLVTPPNDAQARWSVTLEQNYASTAGSVDIPTPTVGQWVSYSIPLSRFLRQGLDPNGIDIMMMGPGWGEGEGVRFRVDNVKIEEETLAPMPDQFTIFADGGEGFVPAQYRDGGSVTWDYVSDDSGHGTVVEFVSNSARQTSYMSASPGPVDLRAYAGGAIRFDMKVIQQPIDPGAEWLFKADCEFPCQSEEFVIGSQADFPLDTWQTVTIDVDEVVDSGLYLGTVTNPLVVFPSWGDSHGAIYRLDNMCVNKAENAEQACDAGDGVPGGGDLGNPGVDTGEDSCATTGSNGGTRYEAEAYIVQSGIQVQGAEDVDGCDNVGYTDPGDYLEYTINAPVSGGYTLDYRLSSWGGSEGFKLLIDGVVVDTQSVADTGGWQNWYTQTSDRFDMDAGDHQLRLEFIGDAVNINWFELFVAAAADSDDDGVPDNADNCVNVANPAQRDTDLDGHGNYCDADLDNDCSVNFLDIGIFKSLFFSSDPDADLDGSGAVNAVDLGILKSRFFAAPGPSASPSLCGP